MAGCQATKLPAAWRGVRGVRRGPEGGKKRNELWNSSIQDAGRLLDFAGRQRTIAILVKQRERLLELCNLLIGQFCRLCHAPAIARSARELLQPTKRTESPRTGCCGFCWQVTVELNIELAKAP